ncbi:MULTISPECIES: FAD-dependent oxidoreductase [unclassified Streptomyces]|uniref:FAD-dependent oxidoreductase n=1 Tax=unclassified Streptomyces TaxID=2593676 RepID=UPI000701964D|nr:MULTISPECIES: FAD-dependent oxidoreductase [unclassified Streptomyces]KQX49868.1 oxidoreductase [Streptomyces sp. Root1304]KRA80089.1 oxidoreductase [Streptomyces sp. Root66D1]
MNRTVDVLVVGAGPAGLAAATRLAAAGAGRVEVLERERTAGGVPRHCARPGFGADALGRPLDGPAYARRAVRAALRAGVTVRTGVSATGWCGPLGLDVTAPSGLERVRARAVVLATGARERPRSARLAPGSRPAGVLTSGELQRLTVPSRRWREPVGRRAVVVGGEPVARNAVRTLRAAGIEVVAVVAEGRARRAAFGSVPVLVGTVVAELHGRGRLTGVTVRSGDGRTATLRCDTVVFTGDWIPDHELARARGLPLVPGTRGPATDGAFRTAEPGVFAVGNLLHGGEPAPVAAAEGRAAADAVLALLDGRSWPVGGVPVETAGPLRWVTPGLLGPVAAPLLLRPGKRLVRPLLTVRQDGTVLRRERLDGTLVPWRSVRLAPRWTDGVDLAGGPVAVGAEE